MLCPPCAYPRGETTGYYGAEKQNRRATLNIKSALSTRQERGEYKFIVRFGMKNDDGRKFSAPELKERRKQVARAYKRGLNKKHISRDIGLSYPAVRNIIARYEEKGAESLVPCKKGRKEGDTRCSIPSPAKRSTRRSTLQE